MITARLYVTIFRSIYLHMLLNAHRQLSSKFDEPPKSCTSLSHKKVIDKEILFWKLTVFQSKRLHVNRSPWGYYYCIDCNYPINYSNLYIYTYRALSPTKNKITCGFYIHVCCLASYGAFCNSFEKLNVIALHFWKCATWTLCVLKNASWMLFV